MGSLWVRLALAGGLAVALFGMGYLYSSTKHAEREAEFEREKALAIVDATNAIAADFRAKLEVSQLARVDLMNNIDVIETHRDSLVTAIGEMQLIKPAPEIRVEACLESDDENVRIVLANPFSESFVGVWNEVPGPD